jgi:uncharacterized protein (TIRG00374 family)
MPTCTGRLDTVTIRKIWRWSRLIGGAGILALLGWRLGGDPFVTGVQVVTGTTLIAALVIGAGTTMLSGWRWSLVAGGLGIRVPLRHAVPAYYRSLFINAVLPGGVLGDVHRAVRHGRAAGDVARSAKAVVLERSAGQITLGLAVLTVLLVAPVPALPAALTGSAVLIAVTGFLAAILVAGILAAGILAAGLAGTRARRGPRWTATIRSCGRDVRSGLLTSGNRLGILAASIGVLAGHLATFVIAARVAGVTAPLAELVPLLLLSLLAMTLPLNVGGWGPREGATAWAFGAAGLGASQGLTIAVVYGMFALVASVPGAAVMAADGIARARADRRPQPKTVTAAALPAIS